MKYAFFILLALAVCSVCQAVERETGDYNFDGHKDYRVYRESNGREHYYNFYLFNPRTKKHVLSKELSRLYNPQFDAVSKEIHCYSPGGWGGAIFIREDYRWNRKHLVLLRVIEQTNVHVESNSGDATLIRVTATIKNGKPSIQSIEPITKEPYIP